METAEQAALASAIAAAISAGAAVLSVIVAGTAMYLQAQWRRPKLVVAAKPSMPVIETVTGSTLGDPMLGIEIANKGGVTVTIHHAGIQLDDGTIPYTSRDSFQGAPSLPHRLDPGDEVTLYFRSFRDVASTVRASGQGPRHAYARIGGGQEFKSSPVTRKWMEGWATVTDRERRAIDAIVLTRRLHLSKGQLIDVEGRLQTRQWDDDAGKRHWPPQSARSDLGIRCPA